MKKSVPKIDEQEYKKFVHELKTKIQSAQIKAALSVNRELIALYWVVGKGIIEKQNQFGWGRSIVKRISAELKDQFPNMRGFSVQNMWHMRAFYIAWYQHVTKLQQAVGVLEETNLAQVVRDSKEAKLPQVVGVLKDSNLPQLVAEIPWGQNIVLIEKIKNSTERIWYAQQVVKNGWSRAVLIHQVESGLYQRQGKGRELTNFKMTLPSAQSDLAQELVKDPYNLEFLGADSRIKEKELQKNLTAHLKDFLLELGVGFSFVGSEYRLEVGGQDFYMDLLFYHLKLRCYVVIELKTVAFQPEFAGKMNFYLSAVDDLITHPDDKPSIGIILCKDKNRTIVEYALRDSRKPMGVSSYKLTVNLPKTLMGKLPSVEDLENELKEKS